MEKDDALKGFFKECEDYDKKKSLSFVSGWRYFSSQKPKLNSDLEIVWSDGTEDIFRWIKPNIEQIDFDIDCRPIKWRYACR